MIDAHPRGGASSKTLSFVVEGLQGSEALVFDVDRLVCCGWSGRDPAALQAHIDELAQLGVPPPTRVPIYMNLSTCLLTQNSEMQVVSCTTSGEVEFVLLCRGEDWWVTVGSDQTDRVIETHSIVASKQMCGKYVARTCWPYTEVAAHWDRLVLRCWTTTGSNRSLYQEAPLASVLSLEALVRGLPDGPFGAGGAVLYSGTIATRAGLSYAQGYEVELSDPVLGRSIRGSYRVTTLAQHV